MKNRFLALMASAALALGGCTVSAEEKPLNSGSFQRPEALILSAEQQNAFADFSLDLLAESTSINPDNPLISPASVFLALGMTMDGAQGMTLSEFESLLGMDADSMNQTAAVLTAMLSDEESDIFTGGNSIWVLESLKEDLSQSWLDECRSNFDADVFTGDMGQETLNAINSWVSSKTDQQIDKLLESMPDNTVMALVNALCFDGQWDDPFEDSATYEEIFTNADGSETETDMMHGEAEYYFSQEDWMGCIKTFAGDHYGFMALLLPENMDWQTALSSLYGEQLMNMLSSAEKAEVDFTLPKMDLDVSSKLKPVLETMGLTSAFNISADFSKLTDGPNDLYVDEVIHQAKLKVDEAGAKAVAATVVTITESAVFADSLTIECSRPYLYAIIDLDNYTPLFIGVQTSF